MQDAGRPGRRGEAVDRPPVRFDISGPGRYFSLAMRVILAGYNVDAGVIEELKRNSPEREDVTPETLSASYARISRDPRPVDELRIAARSEVDKARRSNRNIIFKMGHHSVAEHAVFNFDIIGISRLAVEAVERFRLCSFTEKSQRYIVLGDDFVVPGEIERAGLKDTFTAAVKAQNSMYHRLYGALLPVAFGSCPKEAAGNPKNRTTIEGLAKEDARYIVSLATEGQLGMTVNARNLELLVRRFASSGLEELRELGRMMQDRVAPVAPSIVLFTEATEFDSGTRPGVAAAAGDAGFDMSSGTGKGGRPKAVSLVGHTPDGDERITAALLHGVFGRPYAECLEWAGETGKGGKRKVILEALKRMEFYDFPPREFEHAELVFELVISASCFAQLKRHRMATLTAQPYDIPLGVTIPPAVVEAGLEKDFREVIGKTEDAYGMLAVGAGAEAASYVLTNSHRRRALIKLNLRELYHLSRLREDGTAQWEIREVAAEMSRLARKVMPLSGLLLGGKDAYPELYAGVFGHPPKATPPKRFA